MVAQVEHAQRLATERAKDREASLDEVVVQERNRLARDVHDSVSQQLLAASMMMSPIKEAHHDENLVLKQQLKTVEQMIQQSQLEMRALLMHLRPVQLRGKRLQDGMNYILSELMSRIPIHQHHQIKLFPIEEGIEDQLFLGSQEAVSN